MEETIDLREYFGIIKKRSKLIIAITLVAMIVSAGVSFFVLDPVYETNTTLIVNRNEAQESQNMTGDEINVAQKLAVTYGKIITSRTVLEDVIKSLNLDLTTGQLASKISVGTVGDTQIIDIKVQDTDPQKAMNIANAIPQVFKKEVTRITKANGAEVIDKAVLPKAPIKPNKVMNVAIAAVLGVMIGLFITFMMEYMDTKIKKPDDITKHLDLPILGVIPKEEI
ncbi:MAG: YveK family protein [Peptostreptococcaceae bacterium]